MTTPYNFFKNLALTLLPDVLLRPLREWHYGRVLRGFSDADEPDLKVVRLLVEQGATAVDLGANIGVYTKALSELVGPQGRVISVEPIPQTFESLSRNVRAFAMSNVVCINVAITNEDVDVLMEVPEYDEGGANYYQAQVVGPRETTSPKSTRQLRVRGNKLDSLLAKEAGVSFIKCDIEGQELECIRGAEMVLKAFSPAWLVEVWGDPEEAGSTARQLFQILQERSYVAWWFDDQKLRQRRPGDRSTNYFFLNATHVVRLREKAPHLFAERPNPDG